MSMQSMFIAPFQSGLELGIEPWLAPPDSFTRAENVHVYDGYVQKRSGFRILGQLQTFDSSVAISDIDNDANGTVTTSSAHGYSSGDRVFISGVLVMTEVNDRIFTITVLNATQFEINLNTTSFGSYGGGGTAQKLIPHTGRVMGIYRFLADDGTFRTLAFDTTRAYILNGVTKTFEPLDSAPIMSGSDTDYIWAVNWSSSNLNNRLYFTNGKAFNGSTLDGIRFYNASGTGQTTTNFLPKSLGGSRNLYGGKLLFVIKQRLVVLSTFENDGATTSTFSQRARWCKAQTPSNWNDTTPGGGGFVDCPTGDQIVSARSLQDVIIVQFTNSVWMLRPVPDPALPFRWEKINDFRACDGKMASVSYDRDVRCLGVRGITATTGVETQRIDQRIPEFTIQNINFNEFEKVFSARSYANRRWWTLYPSLESDENDSALIYDDESQAFTTYTISLNCLGYGNYEEDYALNDFNSPNNLNFNLQQVGEATIQDYFWQDNQESFLGGDTGGVIYELETTGNDNGAEISTVLETSAWNASRDQGGEMRLAYVDIFVDTDNETRGEIAFLKDNDQSPYTFQRIDFLPNLDYVASIINATQADPVQITAYNHGLETGDFIYIYLVEGMTELNGTQYEITVINDNTLELNGIDGTGFNAYTTGGVIVKRAFYRTKTWKRVFAGGIGYQHRMRMTASGASDPFRIHAFQPTFVPSGRRTIN